MSGAIHLPRQDPLDGLLRFLHLAHTPRCGAWAVARVGHDAELLGELTEQDALEFVFAEVDAGGVAAEGHVEGHFVQFPSHRQWLAL
jgi:hypothetical protein